jgi:hypothetical protein
MVGVMDLAMAQWLVHKEDVDMGRLAESIRDILRYGVNEK